MASKPLLLVNEEPISLQQALQYLQAAGKLGNFMGDILRQYILETETQNLQDTTESSAVVEQAIIDFRLQQQLTDPQSFQQWLASQGTDYASFHQRVAAGIKVEALKQQVTEPKIQEFFIERKIFLDRVVLSRIVVETQELAEELKTQIEEGMSFEQLAREYSISDDRLVNGMMGPVSRGTLPDILRAMVDVATPGAVVGPVDFEKQWVLFRVEQSLPASLDDPGLRQALQNELFEQWISEKLQSLQVQLQIGDA